MANSRIKKKYKKNGVDICSWNDSAKNYIKKDEVTIARLTEKVKLSEFNNEC